jgi:murein DD-endopeptidase MepM/ murein hydrolase activator NlpD
MKNIITGQHIRRRKQPPLFSRTKVSHRKANTAGHGSSRLLIEQIRQKPSHKKNKKTPLPGLPGNFFFSRFFRAPLSRFTALFKGPGTKDKDDENQSGERVSKTAGTPRFSPFPLFLIILGGICLVSVLAAVQPGEFLKGILWKTYFAEPQADEVFQENLASYAGLNPVPVSLGEQIPLDLMEAFAWKSYTVKDGDSVSRIAADYAISMDAIIASNNITNVRRLRKGEVLRIPNMDGIPHTVIQGETLSKISAAMEVPLEAILDANDIQNEDINPGQVLFIPGAKMRKEDLKLALGELFIYPVRGRLSSPFGWRNDPISGERRYHAALDLAANTGTPVNAALDGRISTVGFNSVYGRYIIISHNGGYQTMYAHLSLASVRQGAYVYQGSKIGEVGSTGYSTGPHLHFAIYKNGTAIDPLGLLSP